MQHEESKKQIDYSYSNVSFFLHPLAGCIYCIWQLSIVVNRSFQYHHCFVNFLFSSPTIPYCLLAFPFYNSSNQYRPQRDKATSPFLQSLILFFMGPLQPRITGNTPPCFSICDIAKFQATGCIDCMPMDQGLRKLQCKILLGIKTFFPPGGRGIIYFGQQHPHLMFFLSKSHLSFSSS